MGTRITEDIALGTYVRSRDGERGRKEDPEISYRASVSQSACYGWSAPPRDSP